jgi:hypothetical protein
MQEGEPDRPLAEIIKNHILQTLILCDGNRTHTAKRLGISIRCLRDKLRQYAESGAAITAPQKQFMRRPGRGIAADGRVTSHVPSGVE